MTFLVCLVFSNEESDDLDDDDDVKTITDAHETANMSNLEVCIRNKLRTLISIINNLHHLAQLLHVHKIVITLTSDHNLACVAGT